MTIIISQKSNLHDNQAIFITIKHIYTEKCIEIYPSGIDICDTKDEQLRFRKISFLTFNYRDILPTTQAIPKLMNGHSFRHDRRNDRTERTFA